MPDSIRCTPGKIPPGELSCCCKREDQMDDASDNSHCSYVSPVCPDTDSSLLPVTRNSHLNRSNEGCAEVILEQQHRLLDVFSRELKHHRSVAILGFPSHENKGDSAIWVGEKILLAALGVNTVYQADWQTYSRTQLAMTINRHPDLLILLHGGGNFGDLYPWEMDGRLKVVQHFPDTPIRFFPQSIHFNDHARMLDVRDQLVQHSDLGVVVRDVPSLERANALFAQTDVKVM